MEHLCATGEDRERRWCDGAAKVSGHKPEGVENAGGDAGRTADSDRDEDPEVDATFAGVGQPTGERRQRREGNGHREVVRLGRRNKPL